MNKQFWLIVSIISSLLMATPAWAYVGPGAGLSAIGSLIALVVAVLVAIIGFVWYPVKRLMRKNKEPSIDESEESEAAITMEKTTQENNEK